MNEKQESRAEAGLEIFSTCVTMYEELCNWVQKQRRTDRLRNIIREKLANVYRRSENAISQAPTHNAKHDVRLAILFHDAISKNHPAPLDQLHTTHQPNSSVYKVFPANDHRPCPDEPNYTAYL